MAVTSSRVGGETKAPAKSIAPEVASGVIGGSLATLC